MATYHPFSDTESKAPTILAIAIVFLILTYLSVGARCYVRTRIVQSFGWDDGLMVVALAFFTMWAGSIIVTTVKYGGGTRVQLIGTAHHWVMASETSYILAAMVAKLSLGVFFLRLIIKPWQRAMVYTIMALISITSIFFFFFLIFHCGNPKDYLIRYIYDQCSPRDVQLALTYLSAAIGAFADWAYALIPIQIAVEANMDLRSKLSVFFILSLGTAGCVCSTIRLRYVRGLISPTDFFWNAAMLAIWSGIECGAAITAGSLATLRPLVKHWFARLVRSSLAHSLSACCGRGRRHRRRRRRRSNNVGSRSRRSGGEGVVAGGGGGSGGDGGGGSGGGGDPAGGSSGGSGGGDDDSQKGSRSRSGASKSWPVTSSSGVGSSSDGSRAAGGGGGGATRSLATWRSSGYWEKIGGGRGMDDDDEDDDDEDDDTRDLTALTSLGTRHSGSDGGRSSVEDVEMEDLPPEPSLGPEQEQEQEQGRYVHGERQEQWQDQHAALTTQSSLGRQRLSTIDEQRRESGRLEHISLYDVDLESGRPFTIDAEGWMLDAEDLRTEVIPRPPAARTRR